MALKIAPYKMGSQSARYLARQLRVLRTRQDYLGKQQDILLNWGRSQLQIGRAKVINKPSAVANAANKLNTFKILANNEVPIPDWTEYKHIAQAWIENGNKVYCRTHLTGHSGSGIVIATTVDELVDAPLYTLNAKHKYEYRIHVFKGEVIDIQQKKKRTDWEGPSITGIRNHSNGWIFARADVTVPDKVINASVNAVAALELDFGAVDIGYNESQDKAIVFEVNTAPGLTGTTLEKYVEAIRRL